MHCELEKQKEFGDIGFSSRDRFNNEDTDTSP